MHIEGAPATKEVHFRPEPINGAEADVDRFSASIFFAVGSPKSSGCK
jgi:hypothetical protein